MTSEGEPFWLLGVVGIGDGSTPVVAIQPATEETHRGVLQRFRRAGYGRISTREWDTATWPLSPTSALDVVGGDLIRVTTGTASIYTAQPVSVTPMWVSAARERRALVGLVPAGSFETEQMTTEEGLAQLGELAGRRVLVGAMAQVRFDMPISRPAAR
jgi:hypothetical protein